MSHNRDHHKRFLELELQALADKYRELLRTKATLLRDNNEIYATLFVRITTENESGGQLILRFRKSMGVPRKNEYFTAVVLPSDIAIPKYWGNMCWKDLRQRQIEFSEVHCIWHGEEDEKGFMICGFKGLSTDMANYLLQHPNCVVILGPQKPPIEYYQNLIDVLSIYDDPMLNEILDFNRNSLIWDPQPVSKDFTCKKLLDKWESSGNMIVQGPPGTGKTYRIAQIVSSLLDRNKSVLVTSLTNRALLEIAEKESLKSYLKSNRVFKTALTTDEKNKIPELLPVNGAIPSVTNGHLILASFYISSGWAKEQFSEKPFDYVIMDEASQALFAMIGAVTRLGKKVMWVGDQNQLPPIINMGIDTIIHKAFTDYTDGFSTLTKNLDYQSFILKDTFRLQKHAAELTSLFYEQPLESCYDGIAYPAIEPYAKQGENISFLLRDFKPGDKYISKQTDIIINVTNQIMRLHPKSSIAIISKLRATIRSLQQSFLSSIGYKNNITIDTVERIQGMTCDYCIYVIPNTLMHMSLDRRLFNVATSRATQWTLIIGSKEILQCNCHPQVKAYLSFLLK